MNKFSNHLNSHFISLASSILHLMVDWIIQSYDFTTKFLVLKTSELVNSFFIRYIVRIFIQGPICATSK